MSPQLLCDLHTHSICSDGADRPEDLIAIAKAAGLGAVALTDHNSTEGLARFEAAASEAGIIAVPGIEVTAGYDGREVHIVGLFVSPAARAPLADYLSQMNERKRAANRDLIERLRADGYMIEEAAVCDLAGHALPNRMHVAKELVRHGYAASISDAFRDLLSEGGRYYRPAQRLDAFAVIDTMVSLSILPVLAHPLISLTEEQLRAFLPAARDHGLVAMEVLYAMYTPEQTALAAALAREFDLLPSGGSDYHGANRPGDAMGVGQGDLAVPMAVYENLYHHHKGGRTMTLNEYQALAMTTLNPELERKDVLINSVMGLCGESGEAIDIVKKWLAHGHPLDKEHLAKELGDIAWYLAEAATALDLSLEEVCAANIEKLKARYPEGFSTERSLHRPAGEL